MRNRFLYYYWLNINEFHKFPFHFRISVFTDIFISLFLCTRNVLNFQLCVCICKIIVQFSLVALFTYLLFTCIKNKTNNRLLWLDKSYFVKRICFDFAVECFFVFSNSLQNSPFNWKNKFFKFHCLILQRFLCRKILI